MLRRMRRFAGLSLVLVAGCLDTNPVFVEPKDSEGETQGSESTAGPPTTGMPPTTTPPTTMEPGTATEMASGDGTTSEPPDTESSNSSTTMPPGVCGDGEVNPGEACDDANDDETDDCLPGCVAAECGDGKLWVGKEDCDDGNAIETDACLSTCAKATCGDGQVWKDFEGCDDANMVDTDTCFKCKPAKCGDGVVQDGVEECDDGDEVPENGCEPMICKKTTKVVFVTSMAYPANLGGIMGAHVLCEVRAAAGGLPMLPYRAWLSDSQTSPSKFMSQSMYPYVKTNGELVASNWAELTSGTLKSPIDRNEFGLPAAMIADNPCGAASVHSNTDAQGDPVSLTANCGNWKSTMGVSRWGNFLKTSDQWTDACGEDYCNFKAPIYCIEQ